MKHFLTLILAAALSAPALADGTSTAGTKLFTSNTQTVSDTNPTHRIPAIVCKGDTIIAFADERYGTNGGDTGSGRIDVVCRVSTDGGQTWGSQQTVAQGYSSFAYGDPAVVCDRETGKLLVMMASGTTSYSSSEAKNNNGTVNTSSALKLYKVTGQLNSDGTITWGTPTDMSSSIYGLYLYTTTSSGGNRPGRPGGTTTTYSIYVTKAFFGSGRICQSTLVKFGSAFRLYAALTTNRGSVVIYSDDFGETWACLGNASDQPASGGDEAKVEELPNGDVLLVAKNYNGTGRYFNIFHWSDIITAGNAVGTGTWGTASLMNNTSTMPIARCNGEIYFVRATNASTSADAYVALMSAPASSSREKVAIYWKAINSKDDCNEISDWTDVSAWTQYPVSSTTSAYSTMRQQGDESIAFLYEENNSPHNGTEAYDIVYKNFTLSEITGGQYTGDDPWEGKIVTLKARLNNNGTVTEYYLHDKEDGTNTGGIQIEAVEATSAPETLDPSYYWVISKAPLNGANYDPYYYISNFKGDGYLGLTTGTDYSTGETVTNALGCTNDYTQEFHFRDFVKESIRENGNGDKNVEMYGQALNFFDLRTGQYNKNKYVSLGLNTSTGATELNWHDHTIQYENTNSNGVYWTTDFVMTAVERINPNEQEASYGTKEAPTEYGFPVTFTRHDNTYQLRDFEDYHYYATLKLPFAVSLPSNVTAYKVSTKQPTSTKDNYYQVGLTALSLETSQYGAKVLPRETPVLLCMTNSEAGDDGQTAAGEIRQTVYLNPEDAVRIQSTGFAGTLGKRTFLDSEYNPSENANFFLLSKKSGRVAFRYATSQTINANKAYYIYDGDASAKELSFLFTDDEGGETTRIDRYMAADADADQADAPIYDLTGRRVMMPTQKGIYVKNGRKFVVK